MTFHRYEDALAAVFQGGVQKTDRTGTGTYSMFGLQIRYDLSKGFPLITTKKVHFKSVVAELLWFLSGSTNVKDLQALGCTIWDEWADESGDLGPVYGKQWRDFGGVDQISALIEGLRSNPHGRRHIVSAWNVAEIAKMALPPCHALFQFDVTDGRLSCQVYQRSADMFLGVPFNLASYALLTHMVAAQCELAVGDLIWTGGDCHIYSNHVHQVAEQLNRQVRGLPDLHFTRNIPGTIFDHVPDDFRLIGYDPHPAIKAPVAV